MEDVKVLLEACLSIEKPSCDQTALIYEELNNKSELFPIKFPVQTIRSTTLCQSNPKKVLEENIISTYPMIHEKVLNLMCKFLLHKRQYGTTKEQVLYKNMSIEELIDRLLRKRSVMFCGPRDKYLLLTGELGMSGWEEIGTDNEKEPLVLKNCLSYDEMKLSALLYVSGPTVFINDGSRNNKGKVSTDLESIERFGIIIGLIGTRLQKQYVMEFQEILLNKKQNSAANGYGSQSKGIFKRFKSSDKRYLWRQIWAGFYGESSLTFEEGLNIHKNEESKIQDMYSKRFNYDRNTLFDNLVYSNHISIAFDCAILESNKRATEKGKMAYLHVVGIGLGVWRAFNHQDNIFVKTFLERLKILAPQLSGLSDVDLAYMRNISKDILDENGKFIECGTHPLGGIKVHLSQRQPSSKLSGEHENKLLVETYAWDGNAQPGNEFWKGSLNTSGDPAAACSSQVAELHNSHINDKFVCGKNLHIVGEYGVRHVSEYAKLLLERFIRMENKRKVLEKCTTVKQPKKNELISVLKELKQNSDKFPIKFPIKTVRCKSLSKNVSESTLKNNISSTYPLIHEKVLRLFCSFLLYKRSYGSQKEKELYKDMDAISLVDRLLLNRSVSFCGHGDHYILLTGKTGSLGWERIGSDEEKEPLVLKNCLSYDEIKLSAMLYVSGATVFINDGSRYNEGVVEPIDKNIEQQGIIMGLIGTRFEKKNTMECQEILINHSQNSRKNGYGVEKQERSFNIQSGEFITETIEDSKWLWRQVWAEFYNEPRLTFGEAIKLYKEQSSNSEENIPRDYYTKRFVCNNDVLFDNTVYSKHISIAFDCAMLEASHRAKEQGKMAYLHVVGIGLGVWRAFFHQGFVFVKTFLERLRKFSPQLVGLSDVHFAYFREIPPEILPKDGTYIECESHPLGGIHVHISDREPSSKLTGEHENKLLVETYAWDGNAQPGNEFWSGNLSGSGDPAAACSSQVAELHNAHINTRFVCGNNLHVAGPHGVRHVGEYVQLIIESEGDI